MESASTIIRFEDVSKSYVENGTTRTVLQHINAEIEAGEVVTIVGPSGSGKSTLLSLCNLMVTPDEGRVYVEDREVRQWRGPDLRRRVGMVFQTPTVFPGTVLDNLNLGPQLRGESVQSPEAWLEKVELTPDVLQQNAEELSGGQRQRIAILRTLINEPRILLLDEVTSALDPSSTQVVERLLQEWQRDTGGTMLWVTHHLEQARRNGSTTWFVNEGELVEKRETASFFAHPEDEQTEAFLHQSEEGYEEKREEGDGEEEGRQPGTTSQKNGGAGE